MSAVFLLVASPIVAWIAVVALRHRRGLGIVALAGTVLTSWILLANRVDADATEADRRFEQRVSRDEAVTMEETLDDGGGDGLVAGLFGWLPASIGGFLGFGWNMISGRRGADSPRRGFPVAPLRSEGGSAAE
jgi:hypothetical protein